MSAVFSRAFFHLVWMDALVFSRSRVGMFWTFAFPLISLIAYVQLFTGPTLLGTSVVVRVSDRSPQLQSYSASLSSTLSKAGVIVREAATHGETLAIVSIVHRSGTSADRLLVKITPSGANPAAFGLLVQQTSNFTTEWNKEKNGPPSATIAIAADRTTASARHSAYVVPGLLVMVVLSSALMGFAVPLVAAREFGLTRQQSLWPVPSMCMLAAWALSRLLIILTSAAIVIVTAVTFYGFGSNSTGVGFITAMFLLIVGSAALLSLGLLIGARVKSTQAALVISNAIYFMGIITGNLIIPTASFPASVQSMLVYSPLNAIGDAMRLALAQRSIGDFMSGAIPLRLIIMSMFGVVCFSIAASTYRWSSR